MPDTPTLTDWQAKHLQQHGNLTLLVPMVPQPTCLGKAGTMVLAGADGESHVVDHSHGYTILETIKKPHRKGDMIEVYICNEPELKGSIIKTLTADPEPVDVMVEDEDLAVECGYMHCCDGGRYSGSPCGCYGLAAYGDMLSNYQQTHGPDKPWAWIYRLESE